MFQVLITVSGEKKMSKMQNDVAKWLQPGTRELSGVGRIFSLFPAISAAVSNAMQARAVSGTSP